MNSLERWNVETSAFDRLRHPVVKGSMLVFDFVVAGRARPPPGDLSSDELRMTNDRVEEFETQAKSHVFPANPVFINQQIEKFNFSILFIPIP
ncbi:MAG: hypothetical protein R2879_22380 [Saprospiraceae bacterium]